MLVYVLAAVLCCLYASDTVIIAYNYRFYDINPSSSKIVLLAELFKLVIASGLHVLQQARWQGEQPSTTSGSGGSRDQHAQKEVAQTAVVQAYFHLSDNNDYCTRWWRIRRQLVQWWWLLPRGFQDNLAFSVPAVCYFFTNNLCFWALQLMSAHVYTLLGDLRVVATAMLNYIVLGKHLSRQGIMSLCLLLIGIVTGQVATNRTSAQAGVSETAAPQVGLLGVGLMLLISLLSAYASVYTEWVMNHVERYQHESLSLQNIRLYSAGIFLNGVYFIRSGGLTQPFLTDMRPLHWVLSVLLACMGLITGLLIKRYGNIIKVYAAAVASLFAAAISHTLLHDPPLALFYVGVGVAMVATVQLQRVRSKEAAMSQADGSAPHLKPLLKLQHSCS